MPHQCRTLKISIIHPTPVVRLGLVKMVENCGIVADVKEFNILNQKARETLDPESILLIDSNTALAEDDWLSNQHFNIGVLLPSGAQPCTKLLSARGINGAVQIDASEEQILTMISMLAVNRTYFSNEKTPSDRSITTLSQRQLEILQLMTRGLLNKQIAWELGLTEGTVKSHVSAILEKMKCSRRTQAIAAFMQSWGLG
jgi:DNA-binding NarL/FixJ family response regulator